MKLKNKKTGEVIILIDHIFDNYSSLDELNEDWEEVKPEGPLIKDEKIRKAIRAWAEANGVGVVLYKEDNYRFYADDTEIGSMIEFENMPEYIGLKHEHRYTIDELCGEDEND